MYSIEIMVDEHRKISRMLKVMRTASWQILQGQELDFEDFADMIDFVRQYADAHHHGKEEKILFVEVQNRLGDLGKNLVTHGMLVEHDWGRLFISELTQALDRLKKGEEKAKLDIIANAVGYAAHLERHIVKEDTVAYPFAERSLPAEVLAEVDEKTRIFEADAKEKNVQEYFEKMLLRLEEKYQD